MASDASRTLTVRADTRAAGSGRGWMLYVLHGATVVKHALPDAGRVTLGRGRECDVCIDHASVSRAHAVLMLGSSPVIEDLGGSNGVRIGDRVLHREATSVAAGAVLVLGEVTLVLQHGAAQPTEIRAEAVFDEALRGLEAELVRFQRPFAAVVIRADDHAAREAVLGVLRPTDSLSAHRRGVLHALLPDTPASEASALADRMRRALQQAGVSARVGVGTAPADGRAADAIVARAVDATRDEPEQRPVALTWLARVEPELVRIARGDIPVLVIGETGAGKELVAETLHRSSPRAHKPLLRLNCGSFSETLLASELFGHERGAFTGAERSKPGLLETADGGTVMLDEIGELPLALQPNLLRVLEDKHVLRVGALKPKRIDVRFVAVTNRDLEADVAQGRFREDLYYRIAGHVVSVPPLRERPDEIVKLATHFLGSAARLSDDAIAVLLAYSWPGNVRELRNVMERAVLLCTDGVVTAEHLPTERMRARRSMPPPSPAAAPSDDALAAALRERERLRILDALAACGGNQTRAARMLGVARNTLLTRMDEFGLARPRRK